MRRFVVVVITVFSMALVAAAGPAVAATPGIFTFRGAKPTVPNSTVTGFQVRGGSDRGIAKIELTVDNWNHDQVVGVVDDFELVDGTTADGTWRSRSTMTLERKNYTMRVRMVDLDGNERTLSRLILRNGLVPEFTEYSMSPTKRDIDHPMVSFSGRLVFREEDGSERPLGGHSVVVRSTDTRTTTDATGRFSGSFKVSSSRSYEVASTITEDYQEGVSVSTGISFVPLPTRISAEVSTSQPAVVGGTAVVTGLLERQSQDGEWAKLPGAQVFVSLLGSDSGGRTWAAPVVTDADGRYRASIPITEAGWVEAANTDFDAYLPVGYKMTSETAKLQASYRTQVTGLRATPNPVGKGTKLTLSGRVTRLSGPGAQADVNHGYLDVEYSTDGRKWQQRTYGHTDAQGLFSIPVKATADGRWRVVYMGPSDNSAQYTPDLDAVSTTTYVDVRYGTAVSSFNATPEPVSKGRPLTVSGVVKRSLDGKTWKTWSGQTVYVYFKAKGATSWSYAGTVKSDSYGKFRRSFTASKDGTWKAVYKGNADHLRADSATDYVDVR